MPATRKHQDKNGRTISYRNNPNPPLLEGLQVTVGPGEFCSFAKIEESMIEPLPWQCFSPGDIIKRMRGSNTSAAFVDVHLLPGHALRYRGTFDDLSLSLVVFDAITVTEDGEGENTLPEHYRAVYHRFEGSDRDDPCLIFHTFGNSSRVVQISMVH